MNIKIKFYLLSKEMEKSSTETRPVGLEPTTSGFGNLRSTN